jgi:RimJ/RimL family protein N-acetyltransferase
MGIGEPEARGQGFGSEVLQLLLRYAFTEFNLHRVSLNAFEYNPRAIHLYEKTGFTVEGRTREFLNRDGRRWDMIFMGILQEEWQAHNAENQEG